MMKSEKEIADKVHSALESLDGIKRAEAPAFFYTRVEAALREEMGFWGRTIRFVTKPAVAFGILFLILLLNGSLVIWKDRLISDAVAEETIRQDFAEEYNLAVSTFYDYENK